MDSRTTKLQLVTLYKIINGLLVIHVHAAPHLTPTPTRAIHSKKLREYSAKTYDTFKLSFFPRITPVRNSLPDSIVEAPDLVHVKKVLSFLCFNQGRSQSASRLRGSTEQCKLCDHTKWKVLWPDWSDYQVMN